MELSYDYIKNILNLFKQNNETFMSFETLDMNLKSMDCAGHYEERLLNHLLVLEDMQVVASIDNSSITINTEDDFDDDSEMQDFIIDRSHNFRITVDGYKYLEILGNDSIMKKLKKITIDKSKQIGISIAIEAAKQLILANMI